MPSDVTREEFQHLATRTDILEREVEGEKMVTRHILEQTRRNGDDLAEIKTDLKALIQRVDGLDHKIGGLDRKVDKVDGLDRKVDGLDRKVDGLSREFREWRRELPGIVGDILREAIEPLTRKR